MDKAKKVAEAINVVIQWYVEGTYGIESECADFDAYKKLPEVVEFSGRMYSKTGWNSDRGIVCYQSGRPIAIGQ